MELRQTYKRSKCKGESMSGTFTDSLRNQFPWPCTGSILSKDKLNTSPYVEEDSMQVLADVRNLDHVRTAGTQCPLGVETILYRRNSTFCLWCMFQGAMQHAGRMVLCLSYVVYRCLVFEAPEICIWDSYTWNHTPCSLWSILSARSWLDCTSDIKASDLLLRRYWS